MQLGVLAAFYWPTVFLRCYDIAVVNFEPVLNILVSKQPNLLQMHHSPFSEDITESKIFGETKNTHLDMRQLVVFFVFLGQIPF